MTANQQLFSLVVCVVVFLLTIELVRRRHLREEYSVLWLATSLAMFIIVLRYEWLAAITRVIGAVLPTTTIFLGALVFLLLIVIQFSIKLSQMANQVKNLGQEAALLRAEVERINRHESEKTKGTTAEG